MSLQTNTSLFCTLCPHSCAPGKNFPVGHPSRNCSRPSTFNFGVLSRLASEKEVATCWYKYPINPIKPSAGVSHTDRKTAHSAVPGSIARHEARGGPARKARWPVRARAVTGRVGPAHWTSILETKQIRTKILVQKLKLV